MNIYLYCNYNRVKDDDNVDTNICKEHYVFSKKCP